MLHEIVECIVEFTVLLLVDYAMWIVGSYGERYSLATSTKAAKADLKSSYSVRYVGGGLIDMGVARGWHGGGYCGNGDTVQPPCRCRQWNFAQLSKIRR